MGRGKLSTRYGSISTNSMGHMEAWILIRATLRTGSRHRTHLLPLEYSSRTQTTSTSKAEAVKGLAQRNTAPGIRASRPDTVLKM